MQNNRIQNVVIVGGGTAGWMSASLLAKLVGREINITLIESDDIGTVGVGEATIPPIQIYNNVLGLNEDEFLRETKGTFKLGIEFQNWGKVGDKYMHAFGPIGRDLGMTPFQHYWLRARQDGKDFDLWDFSYNYQAGKAYKFDRQAMIPNSPMQGIVHAFHFDAGLYARYLRKGCEQAGVTRVEGIITTTHLCPETGFIKSVELENGTTVDGDLFIDCSGQRALLIEDALKAGYEHWSDWLPCDRAIALPSENVGPARPYTQSIAYHAGWQWRIPLQHRTGNGIVYSSTHMSDDEAEALLRDNIEGTPIAEARGFRFNLGRRKKIWHKNCVAIGLSSGFLEPLESTSIHLIQTGIVRLAQMFPSSGFESANIDEYNRQITFEYEKIRDFIILHYHLNQRTDSAFWTECRDMDIPETLKHKIDLFRETGRVFRENNELFSEAAWVQVMVGQNLIPDDYSPLADSLGADQVADYLGNLKTIIDGNVAKLPTMDNFIRDNCAADQ